MQLMGNISKYCCLRLCSVCISSALALPSGGLYEISLDRRKLKTPGGKLFTVPNEALAIAVATEWDAQKDTLKFYTMHLVRPINTGTYDMWFTFCNAPSLLHASLLVLFFYRQLCVTQPWTTLPIVTKTR